MSHTYGRTRRHERRLKKPAISRCGRTGKVGFKSHEAAIARGGEILASGNAKVTGFRAYICAFCAHWHLTSQV